MREADEASSTREYWDKRDKELAEDAARPMSLYEMERKSSLARQRSYELKEEFRGDLLAEAAKWDRRIEEAKAKGQVV